MHSGTVTLKLITKIFVRNSANKYLVLKRSAEDRYRPGEWDLPGGKIDIDENPNDAVLRELNEETGLSATNIGIVHVDSEIDPVHTVSLFYVGIATSENVVLSHEHSEHVWLTKKEILNLELPEDFKKASSKI